MKVVYKRIKNGFTLVELLVVIAIIAVLAAISTPIVIKMLEKARVVEAEVHMKEFVAAAKAYEKDHYSITSGIPIWGSNTSDAHAYTASTGETVVDASNYGNAYGAGDSWKYIRALTGGGAGASTETRKNYLNIPDHKGYRSGVTRNGSDEIHGLLDPWGRTYALIIDFDRDGKMTRNGGYMGDYDGKTINLAGNVVGLFSPGIDGVFGGGDDISSWGN